MRPIARFVGLGLVALTLVGCAARETAGQTVWPDDLALSYHWVGETVPPPDHYEYTITIGPTGGGEITFSPDYPADSVPEWRGQFVADPQALAALYHDMIAADLFEHDWQVIEDPPVGGSNEWLRVSRGDHEITVPAQARDANRLQVIYTDIQTLVPAEIWQEMWSQREAYRREYGTPQP